MGLSAEAFARMLKALLPPGRGLRSDSSSVIGEAMLGASDELVRVDGRVADLLLESDPRTADELLPEFEDMLALPSDGTLSERRNRIVAQLVTLQRRRAADYQRMLAPILGLAEEDVEVIERGRAYAQLVGDDDEIYRFFVYRNPGLAGSYDIVSAQALLDSVSDSHTRGYAIESISMRCNDPLSLCDRDLLAWDCDWWSRADQFLTLSGSDVSAAADLSGKGHGLTASGAGRPTFVEDVVHFRSAIRFGPTAADKFMSWTPWGVPIQGTAYFVVRVRTTTAYQILAYANGGPSLYLGGDGTDFARNRPALYQTTERAVWSADLIDTNTYLIRFAWNYTGATEAYWTQVNESAQVSDTSSLNVDPGNFNSLGLDPGVVNTQDLISDFLEGWIFPRLTGGTLEETMLRGRVERHYGLVMV
jgi:uncharacterized protein YmfQ (DUF2313 family)